MSNHPKDIDDFREWQTGTGRYAKEGSMSTAASREQVYDALDSERAYQESRWNPETTSTGGKHSVHEFVGFMQDYVAEAMHVLAREGEPGASEKALNIVRKVGGLAVACMEQRGAPRREGF